MEPLNKVLKETAAKMGLSNVYEAGILLPKWKELVGDQVAKNAEPLMIQGKTLVVRTASPIWSHQLAMIKPQILAKLRDAGVEISDLSFRAASPPERKRERSKKSTIQAPPKYTGVSEEIRPELRRALASFLGARAARDGTKGKE